MKSLHYAASSDTIVLRSLCSTWDPFGFIFRIWVHPTFFVSQDNIERYYLGSSDETGLTFSALFCFRRLVKEGYNERSGERQE